MIGTAMEQREQTQGGTYLYYIVTKTHFPLLDPSGPEHTTAPSEQQGATYRAPPGGGHTVPLSGAPDRRPRGRGAQKNGSLLSAGFWLSRSEINLAHCSHLPRGQRLGSPGPTGDRRPWPQGWGQRRQRRSQLFFPPHTRPTQGPGTRDGAANGPTVHQVPRPPHTRDARGWTQGCRGAERARAAAPGPAAGLGAPWAGGRRFWPLRGLHPSPGRRTSELHLPRYSVDQAAQGNAGRKAGGPSSAPPRSQLSRRDRQTAAALCPSSASPRPRPPMPCARPCHQGLQRGPSPPGDPAGPVGNPQPRPGWAPEPQGRCGAAASGRPTRLQPGGQPGWGSGRGNRLQATLGPEQPSSSTLALSRTSNPGLGLQAASSTQLSTVQLLLRKHWPSHPRPPPHPDSPHKSCPRMAQGNHAARPAPAPPGQVSLRQLTSVHSGERAFGSWPDSPPAVVGRTRLS